MRASDDGVSVVVLWSRRSGPWAFVHAVGRICQDVHIFNDQLRPLDIQGCTRIAQPEKGIALLCQAMDAAER